MGEETREAAERRGSELTWESRFFSADVRTIQFCKASTRIDRLRLCSYYTGTGSHTGLIGLLFTHTNGDFGANSVTAPRRSRKWCVIHRTGSVGHIFGVV